MRNLAIARKLKDMSQRDLAEKVGISTQSISNYESGTQEPTSSKLLKLSDILGVSIDYLCGKDN